MTEKNSAHFPYLPHTQADREAMLKAIGVSKFEDLIKHVPKQLRAEALKLASGLSELELTQHISAIAQKNTPSSKKASFLGGGSYRRFVPAVVPSVISRSEFSTAYTPYQPEVSQGSLQVIYEFQTAVALLTGMDVANASMYDGPTACAEAALMAHRQTSRNTILALGSVNPEYRMVTKTYVNSCALKFETHEIEKGVSDGVKLPITEQTACVIAQYPNYFGCLEDLESLAKQCHDKGALLVVVTEPISLGVLTPPGEMGADIVVGDAQPCGNFLSFGGPSAGYMASRKEFVRQLPGRLAGMTVDNRGQRAFTLTLQTREQHIRRARATSNICTNQALNALAMLVYITSMGPEGLKDLGAISIKRAHHLAAALTKTQGVRMLFDAPYFNEFAIATPYKAQDVLKALGRHGVSGGIDLGSFYPQYHNAILIAVTEMNDPKDLEKYAEALPRALAELKESGCQETSGERQKACTAP